MAKGALPGKVIGGAPIESEADQFIETFDCGAWLACREPGRILLQQEWHADGEIGLPPGAWAALR